VYLTIIVSGSGVRLGSPLTLLRSINASVATGVAGTSKAKSQQKQRPEQAEASSGEGIFQLGISLLKGLSKCKPQTRKRFKHDARGFIKYKEKLDC
jgi:hypothetical protein